MIIVLPPPEDSRAISILSSAEKQAKIRRF